jgi:uncharacterized protein with GYD domain
LGRSSALRKIELPDEQKDETEISEFADTGTPATARGYGGVGLLAMPPSKEVGMFTYVGFFRLAPLAREHVEKTPEYLDKIHKIVEREGGTLERFLAIMGPWEYLGIFKYPDNETAFRVLAEIAKLEIFETETFPAEDVEVFFKVLV